MSNILQRFIVLGNPLLTRKGGDGVTLWLRNWERYPLPHPPLNHVKAFVLMDSTMTFKL
ncbi:hypothetical protein HanXRQr2_Chr10g0449901 [Helianthus annuus]|uniref:Uncharacterized protein n=1 Tax=Helianthus annuus TaxID=4232 RepID=A0A251TMC4_HELAN|nr:hypothetical protein HanXRQr2_Chr10g0449901 [Helianthus annuus]